MIKKEDNLWKGVLEGVFEDFISFMHPGINKILDLSKKPEFLDKELEQVFPPENEKFSLKVVDKLVKVFTHEAKEEWVLLHIEVQGRYRKDFGKRMFSYFYRILDKYDKRIAAYAIFTEGCCKKRASCYSLEFMGTKLDYQFNTYKISSASEEELLADDNPFAIIVLAARTVFSGKLLKGEEERDHLLLELKFKLAEELYGRKLTPEKLNTIMNFLRYYIRFENKALNLEFEKKIEILTGNKRTMGIEEQLLDMATRRGEKKGEKKGEKIGIRKGKDEMCKTFVHNLIYNFGYPEEKIAELLGLSVNLVKKIAREIKTNQMEPGVF